jgi:YVTN family beta-propeller protein
MKTYSSIYWHMGKIIILAALVFAFVTLPGPSINPARAQADGSLMFIENVGQFPGDEQTRYQANAGRMALRLTDDALWITVLESSPVESPAEAAIAAQGGHENEPRQGINLKLTFVDANSDSQLEPFQRLATRVSYFRGDAPANWQTDVPAWGGARYVNVYPGIDWEITGASGQLAQRLVVRGNPENLDALLRQIRLQVDGAVDINVDEGRLRLNTVVGEIELPLFDVIDENGQKIDTSTIQTEIDETKIIAPFSPGTNAVSSDTMNIAGASDLLYSTFLGGEGLLETALGVAVDAEGYAYVTGQAYPGFPFTPGAFDTIIEGDETDDYVAKLSPDGSELVYATFIGGNDFEYSRGIKVDAAGNAYITGNTASTNFPTTAGVFDDTLEGSSETFIAKINPTGTALVYSTLLGGSEGDFGWDLDIDAAGYVYASGSTFSPDFPVTANAVDQTNELGEAYVVKLNPDATELVYATFLGGMNGDYGYDISVDAQGYVYAAGWTVSPDFPVTAGAFDTTYNGSEGYVAKLNADASSLIYATYIGGSMSDYVYAIDLDEAGNAYLGGHTASPDFPVTAGAFDDACTECGPSPTYSDAFVAKLNADGSDLIYASYLGGSTYDYGEDIAVSPSGSVYITGFTYSVDFPTTAGAFDTTCDSCSESIERSDAFVARVNPSGTALAYSTFLGGSDGGDRAEGLAIDGAGNVYLAGTAGSPYFPITANAVDSVLEGMDGFAAKLTTGSDEPEPEPTPTPTPAATPVPDHDCSPTPLGEITVGDTPRGVAVDSSRSRVYVANFGSNSVSVIDSNTNAVLQTITGINSANGLAYDATNNIIWVTNTDVDTLTPIQANADATDFTVKSAIAVGDGPWGVAYQPVYNKVYVANSEGNSLSVVDAAQLSVTATLTDTFVQPFHLAANPRTGKVYVANHGDNWVSVVEDTTISRVIPIWDSYRAYGIAVDETRDLVYVTTTLTNRIVALGWLHDQPDQFLGWASFQRAFDRARPMPLRAIAVNPELGPWYDGGHVWATTATSDGSEANNALLIPKGWWGYFHQPYPVDVDVNPTEGIAVDRSTNRVYISSGAITGTLTVVGDHEQPCWGAYVAGTPEDADAIKTDGISPDGINIDVFSVIDLEKSDVTGDNQVDIFDLVFIAARYNSNDSVADVNSDGSIDIFDLTLVANYYGQRHPGVEQN